MALTMTNLSGSMVSRKWNYAENYAENQRKSELTPLHLDDEVLERQQRHREPLERVGIEKKKKKRLETIGNALTGHIDKLTCGLTVVSSALARIEEFVFRTVVYSESPVSLLFALYLWYHWGSSREKKEVLWKHSKSVISE